MTGSECFDIRDDFSIFLVCVFVWYIAGVVSRVSGVDL